MSGEEASAKIHEGLGAVVAACDVDASEAADLLHATDGSVDAAIALFRGYAGAQITGGWREGWESRESGDCQHLCVQARSSAGPSGPKYVVYSYSTTSSTCRGVAMACPARLRFCECEV